MVGAWLKVNAASVALLVVAVGAGAAAVAVPSSDDSGGGDAFCDAATEVFANGVTVDAFVTARDNGQLETLISEAPDGGTAENLRVIRQAVSGQNVDPLNLQAAQDDLIATLESECNFDVVTTTTAPTTSTTTPQTTSRGTSPTTAPRTTAPTTTRPTTTAPTTT